MTNSVELTKLDAIRHILDNNKDLSISELARRTNLSRQVIHKWVKGTYKNIHEDSLIKLANATDTRIEFVDDKVIIYTKVKTSVVDQSIDKDYILSLQKNTIENLERELKVKDKHIETLAKTPVQNYQWEKITPDFESTVLLKPSRLDTYALGWSYCQESVTNLNLIASGLNMSQEKVESLFDIGKWHEWGKHPVESIMTKDSKDNINNDAPDLEKLFNA